MLRSRLHFVIAASWLLFWALMVSVAVQDYARDGGNRYWQPVLWETSSLVVGLLLMLFLRRATRRHDHLISTPPKWFLVHLAWLPVLSTAFVPLTFGIRHAVYRIMDMRYEHEPWGELFVYEAIKVSVFFGLFIVILFGILSFTELQQERLRAEQAKVLLRQAQLQQLTQQMQPHFLFNALNTISSLMHTDVARADTTLTQLSDVLRATLDTGDRQVAPLSTELRIVRGYAGVMEQRYAGRVRIDWDVDDAAEKCSVPVMSVQPLLENVFKHTVERRRGMTAIAVRAHCTDGFLSIQVEDDAGELALSSAPSGIGLANLRARLAVLHGDAASLELTRLEPAGVRCEMRLPCAC
ncbi:MAG TPA: histidine kinase [Telluria sp.]|nr:histidine kinase [Telluria sp.]